MRYSEIYNLKSGDRLVSRLFLTGFSKHHVIYLDINGVEYIAENNSINGVQLITAEEYFSGIKSIVRIEKFSGNEFQRNYAIQRTLNLQGKAYNLFSYNCEHFANEIQYGKVESVQVANFWALCGLLALGLVISKK